MKLTHLRSGLFGQALLRLACAALLLLLFSEKTTAQTLVRIAGRVVEQGSERPIAGARVHNSSSGETVITRSDGTFDISADTTELRPHDVRFAVYAIGYEPLNTFSDASLQPWRPTGEVYHIKTDSPRIAFSSGIAPHLPPRRAELPLVLYLNPATVELTREVVITARRQASLHAETPRSITVISPRDLRERPVRTVPEALSGTAGVWLQKTNHGGGSPFVRGLTGQQTLLLVDGIRLNNATFRSGPNQYLNTLDPVSVGRIEVLRGSGSVEYGSDAIGGVVNVQTPNILAMPEGWHGQATWQAASQGMEQSGEVSTSYAKKQTRLWLGTAYRDFGDLVAGQGIGRLAPTGYAQWSYNARLRTVLGKKLRIAALWQDLQQNEVPIFHKIQLENFAVNQFDPQRRQFGYVRLQKDNGDRGWFSKPALTLSWQRQTEGRQSRKNGSDKTLSERDDTRTVGISAKFESRPAYRWSVQTGAEIYLDQVGSTREEQTGAATPVAKRGLYPDGASMSSAAVYTLHHFDWNRWQLQAGLRGSFFRLNMTDETLGQVSIQPSALVGNASISRKIGQKTWLYATYNSAFRAPNVDDLGTLGIVDFRYETPNAALRPERSHTAELGAKYQGNRFSATLAGYYTALTDLIGRVRTRDSIQGYAVYRKENIGQAYLRGLEAEAEWRMGRRWTATGHFTYTYGQNVTDREPVRRIPSAHGRAVLRWQGGEAFSIRAESVFASWQRRLAKADVDDNRIADTGTPGWAIVNLHSSWEHKWLILSAELHNIANEAYRMHGSGVDGTGRSLWLRVGLRW